MSVHRFAAAASSVLVVVAVVLMVLATTPALGWDALHPVGLTACVLAAVACLLMMLTQGDES